MTLWTKSFCLVALVNYILLITFSIEPLAVAYSVKPDHDLQVIIRPLLYGVIIVFQGVHTFFGVFYDNIYEVYATMLAQFIVTIIIMTRCIELCPTFTLYNLLLVAYGVVFQVLYVVFALPLIREFSWTFYKRAGADQEFRLKYRHCLQFPVLLKIDLMLSLICILFYAALSRFNETRVIFLCCIGFIAVAHYNVGRVGYSKENTPLVITFWTLSTVLPVFIGFSFWEIGLSVLISNITDIDIINISPEWDFRTYTIFFLVSSTTFGILRLFLLALSVIVFVHFGFIQNAKNAQVWVGGDGENGSDSRDVVGREGGWGVGEEGGLTWDDVFKNTKG